MTNEEALNELKEAMEEQCGNIAFYGDAILKAIEALEKQIPKKQNGHGIGWIDNTCQACGSDRVSLERMDGGVFYFDFCPDCGQALDWSEDDD